jgi:geranylgeranylglycerol-phosphate geranylgeranyltransferase
MRLSRPLLKLTRLDSSSLVALAVFIPLFARTGDLGLSIRKAIPLLFIGMCTFIANDLDDIEKDRINHPERPLPSCHITTTGAVGLYFVCLIAALFSTKFYVQPRIAFWYYLLLTLSISYGYVVDYFSGFKTIYVACATTIPVLSVAITYPNERRLYLVVGSLFFFVLGRELCMDFVDRAGDKASFMHTIRATPLASAAFCLETIGLLLLVIQVDEFMDAAGILLIALLLLLASHCWFKRASYKRAILLMKLQLFVGLYFLA